MRQLARLHTTNGLRNLRLSKQKKRDERNTILGAEDTDEVGPSGCTATPDWCSSSDLSCYTDICDICADSFHPISCPTLNTSDDSMGYYSYIKLLEGSSTCEEGTYTATFMAGASGESRMILQGTSTAFVFDDDTTNSNDGPSPQERWQSSLLPLPGQGGAQPAIYYRLLPGETGNNPPNGEWFLDKWTITPDPPTSCICTAPEQPIINKEYKLAANSTVHQFYVKSDTGLVSFYVTFDGTYVNVFTSNLTTLTANKVGDMISIATMGSSDSSGMYMNKITVLKVISMNGTIARFEIETIDLITSTCDELIQRRLISCNN